MQNAASMDGERSVPIKQAAESFFFEFVFECMSYHVASVFAFRDSVQIVSQMSI